MAATKNRRKLRGKGGTFIGKPHKPSPPKLDVVIPVDPTRATIPIPGLPAGKRKT